MAELGPAGEPSSLSALLSQLLVAFTIEFDNEFEHQMPHRTTRHGSTPGSSRAPWLVSMALWVQCMRFVPGDGISAGELARRARLEPKSARMILTRMSRWWGYLTVGPDPAETRVKPPASDWLVRPTRAGRHAQDVWEPLTATVEQRWRARFGDAEIEQLRRSLAELAGRLELELPDALPIGKPVFEPRTTTSADPESSPTLPALMSKILLALALDFEAESTLSLGIYTADGISRLAISANILRVLDEEGVRVATIPALTGVAKMAIDNWLSSLAEHGYVIVEHAAGGRHNVARLTPKGRGAQAAYPRWSDAVELRWEERFETQPIHDLRASAERLAVDPAAKLLLWQGIEPYPDGWRAQVRRPATLPHYPVVSARGGFPDGS